MMVPVAAGVLMDWTGRPWAVRPHCAFARPGPAEEGSAWAAPPAWALTVPGQT